MTALTERADLAHEQEQKIKEYVLVMRTAWIRLGGVLYDFCSRQLWKELGYTSLEEWMAQPEVELERRMIFKLKGIWNDLVVARGIDPALLEEAAVTKIEEILPSVRTGAVDPLKAIADAKTLSRSDLREVYKDRFIGPQSLDAEREPIYVKCPQCGNWYVP